MMLPKSGLNFHILLFVWGDFLRPTMVNHYWNHHLPGSADHVFWARSCLGGLGVADRAPWGKFQQLPIRKISFLPCSEVVYVKDDDTGGTYVGSTKKTQETITTTTWLANQFVSSRHISRVFSANLGYLFLPWHQLSYIIWSENHFGVSLINSETQVVFRFELRQDSYCDILLVLGKWIISYYFIPISA